MPSYFSPKNHLPGWHLPTRQLARSHIEEHCSVVPPPPLAWVANSRVATNKLQPGLRFLCSLNIFRYVSVSEIKRALFDCPCQKKVVRGLIKICLDQKWSQTVDNNPGGSLPHKYNLKSPPSKGRYFYVMHCRRLQNKEVTKDTASKNIWMMLEVEGGGDD